MFAYGFGVSHTVVAHVGDRSGSAKESVSDTLGSVRFLCRTGEKTFRSLHLIGNKIYYSPSNRIYSLEIFKFPGFNKIIAVPDRGKNHGKTFRSRLGNIGRLQ